MALTRRRSVFVRAYTRLRFGCREFDPTLALAPRSDGAFYLTSQEAGIDQSIGSWFSTTVN